MTQTPDTSRREVAINWTGDLEDDCVARVGEFVAHCEVMFEARVTTIDSETGKPDRRAAESWNNYFWWFAVYRDNKQVLSSGDVGGMVTSGALAREICETVIRSSLASNLPADSHAERLAEALEETVALCNDLLANDAPPPKPNVLGRAYAAIQAYRTNPAPDRLTEKERIVLRALRFAETYTVTDKPQSIWASLIFKGYAKVHRTDVFITDAGKDALDRLAPTLKDNTNEQQ